MTALRDTYGADLFCFKVHGGPMMINGLPDIIGIAYGRPFAIETKMPDPKSKPTERQLYVHARMRRAGCIVGIARNVPEAISIVRTCIARNDVK